MKLENSSENQEDTNTKGPGGRRWRWQRPLGLGYLGNTGNINRKKKIRGNINSGSKIINSVLDMLIWNDSKNIQKAAGDIGLWKEVKSGYINLGFWWHLKISFSFNNWKHFSSFIATLTSSEPGLNLTAASAWYISTGINYRIWYR